MADFISREAAYKTLTEYYHHSSGVQHTVLREALNRVPTADVRPAARGEWEWKNTDALASKAWTCSVCGRRKAFKTSFCPNCGADMRPERETKE